MIQIYPVYKPRNIFLHFIQGWGNARDAIALWKLVLSHRANRVVNSPEDVKTITEADVLKAFDEMIQARTPKVTEKERKMEELRDAMRLLNEPKPKEAVRVLHVQTQQKGCGHKTLLFEYRLIKILTNPKSGQHIRSGQQQS